MIGPQNSTTPLFRYSSLSLPDPKDLIVELGKLFEVGADDLRFYHQILIDSELGKALFQSRPRRRAAVEGRRLALSRSRFDTVTTGG